VGTQVTIAGKVPLLKLSYLTWQAWHDNYWQLVDRLFWHTLCAPFSNTKFWQNFHPLMKSGTPFITWKYVTFYKALKRYTKLTSSKWNLISCDKSLMVIICHNFGGFCNLELTKLRGSLTQFRILELLLVHVILVPVADSKFWVFIFVSKLWVYKMFWQLNRK